MLLQRTPFENMMMIVWSSKKAKNAKNVPLSFFLVLPQNLKTCCLSLSNLVHVPLGYNSRDRNWQSSTTRKDRVGPRQMLGTWNRFHIRTTAFDCQGAHDSKYARTVIPWFGVRAAFLVVEDAALM